MITLLVLNPLTYTFSNTRRYLNVGDRYVLDAVKDRSELEYILSPNFPYPGSFYVQSDPVVEEILQSFEKSVVIEPSTEVVLESPQPERKSDFEVLEQEAEESPFLKPEIISVMGDDPVASLAESSGEVSLTESEVDSIVEERRLILENMGWKDIKNLLENVYNQKYTTKSEAVEQILSIEFKV